MASRPADTVPGRPAALVLGCAGTELTPEERAFFRAANPLGFALFRRNCRDRSQLRALVAGLRDAVGRPDAPVLVDQEGGRVARLKPPAWTVPPAAARFGALARRDPARAEAAIRLNAQAIAADLAEVGIDTVALPVLDLAVPGASDVIGDRALSDDPAIVARLGRAAAEALLGAGIMPIIKHLPGHGRSMVDSHRALPVVDAPLAVLRQTDFRPFRALADMPWGMTAHILYTAIDPDRPATLSATAIDTIIRGEIGFDGVLISDDLSMDALAGPIGRRSAAALAAGCDIALHCNGLMREMEEVAEAAAPLSDRAVARLARARAQRHAADPADAAALHAQVRALLDAG